VKAVVTGGCGFIGSHAVRALLADGWSVTNLDALTYAANPLNLSEIDASANYAFVRADIRDQVAMDRVFEEHKPDIVVHFAAESHVDRSIHGPKDFMETNVIGTMCLLEACRSAWTSYEG
jgi:dTDP-glucose 4,6-dehydratase